MASFAVEAKRVQSLMHALGIAPCQLLDPFADGKGETGIDVVVQHDGRTISVQVTEADFGAQPGQERAIGKQHEKALNTTGVADAWTTDRHHTLLGIERAISGKVEKAKKYDYPGETWLLVSAGLPEAAAILVTLPMVIAIDANDLRDRSHDALVGSKFDRVYFHSIVDPALYQWDRTAGWQQLS